RGSPARCRGRIPRRSSGRSRSSVATRPPGAELDAEHQLEPADAEQVAHRAVVDAHARDTTACGGYCGTTELDERGDAEATVIVAGAAPARREAYQAAERDVARTAGGERRDRAALGDEPWFDRRARGREQLEGAATPRVAAFDRDAESREAV